MTDYSKLKKRELIPIAKHMGLLRPEKDKKDVLVARLKKGKQLSDYSKTVLLEVSQNAGLVANAQMSKGTIIKKLTNPSPQDLGEKRSRELVRQRGVRLRANMSRKDIIKRLENPTAHYTTTTLDRVAEDNNIKFSRGQTKQEKIGILTRANLISPTEKIEVSNLGFMATPNAPLALVERIKRTVPRNAFEDLENYRDYLKNIRTEYLTTTRLCQIKRTLKKKEDKLKEEVITRFVPRKTQSALKQFANMYTIGGEGDNRTFKGYDALTFLNTAKRTLVLLLKKNKGIKVKLDFYCNMSKFVLEVGEVIMPFNSILISN